MSAPLLAAALALLASLPLSLLGWAAAEATERLTRDPRPRERAWSAAFALPVVGLAAAVAAVWLTGLLPQPEATQAAVSIGVLPWQGPATGASASRAPFDWTPAAALLLAGAAAGCILRWGRAVWGARGVAAMAARARPAAHPALERAAARAAGRLGLRAPPLLISTETAQPVLAGLRRPAVLLPEAMAASAGLERLSLVCAHELEHLRRRDNLRMIVEEAAAGAFWFNPVVPHLLGRLRAAREEACDQAVLRGAGPAVRRLYADTLVQALRLRAGPEPASALTGASRRTAMRVQALLRPAPPARLRHRLLAGGLLAGLVLAGGGGAAALAQAARDAAPPPARSFGLHPTPQPAFLKHWEQANRRSGVREAVDVYTGELRLSGPAPSDHPVFVDGRPAPAGQDLGALGPVAALEVRREATRMGGPKPRILRSDIRLASAGEGAGPPASGGRTGASSAAASFVAEAPPIPVGTPKPVISRPSWAARPTGEDLARAYPVQAFLAGVQGRATIQCTVLADGKLSGCEVVSESPPGAGFGAATLAVAPKFRMAPATADGRAVGGGVVRVPVLWQAAEEPVAPPSGTRSQAAPRRSSQAALSRIPPVSGEATLVVADRVEHRPGPPPSSVYMGDVAARGRLPDDGALIYVDGRRAEPGLDLASLGKIDRIEMTYTAVTAASRERQKPTEIRITTAR